MRRKLVCEFLGVDARRVGRKPDSEFVVLKQKYESLRRQEDEVFQKFIATPYVDNSYHGTSILGSLIHAFTHELSDYDRLASQRDSLLREIQQVIAELVSNYPRSKLSFLGIHFVRLYAEGRCEMCGKSDRRVRCETHHRLPSSQGGSDDLSNGVYLCARCHGHQPWPGHRYFSVARKKNRTPETEARLGYAFAANRALIDIARFFPGWVDYLLFKEGCEAHVAFEDRRLVLPTRARKTARQGGAEDSSSMPEDRLVGEISMSVQAATDRGEYTVEFTWESDRWRYVGIASQSWLRERIGRVVAEVTARAFAQVTAVSLPQLAKAKSL